MSEENLKKENDIFYDPYILNCQPESVERELKEIEISVCLENGEISPDIKKDDIVLQKSFQGMQTVENQNYWKNYQCRNMEYCFWRNCCFAIGD